MSWHWVAETGITQSFFWKVVHDFVKRRKLDAQRAGMLSFAGAGATRARTFRPEPESEPSEHFVWSRSGSRLKKIGRASKERKIIRKKTQNVKRENAESIIFTAQFLPFSRTGELEWPQRDSTLPRNCPIPPVWAYWTMVSSDCVGTMAGSRCTRTSWGPSNRGEAN